MCFLTRSACTVKQGERGCGSISTDGLLDAALPNSIEKDRSRKPSRDGPDAKLDKRGGRLRVGTARPTVISASITLALRSSQRSHPPPEPPTR